MSHSSPLQTFLDRQGFVVLDGGLATELEVRGFDLADELWSARVLIDAPDALRQLTYDYFAAGADCVVSASYQATLEGFAKRGFSVAEAEDLLRRSVALVLEARDAFWSDSANRRGRQRPLVAASVGPYGAYLADGSEYRGDYGLDEEALVAFHRRRFEVLAASGADLLACETIPSGVEVRALRRLLEETRDAPPAWVSLSCRDSRHLADGSDLAATVAQIEDCERLVAVGVNCTAPEGITEFVARFGEATSKPIAVYPNSGDVWDAVGRRWVEAATPFDFGAAAVSWHAAGARLIGGCCRTGPGQIREIRDGLVEARRRTPAI